LELKELEVERAKIDLEHQKIEAKADLEIKKQDADTRRITAIAEARARILEAASKLRQEGGEWFLSKENLQTILRLPLPPDDPPKDSK
jgi:hypothetical protein